MTNLRCRQAAIEYNLMKYVYTLLALLIHQLSVAQACTGVITPVAIVDSLMVSINDTAGVYWICDNAGSLTVNGEANVVFIEETLPMLIVAGTANTVYVKGTCDVSVSGSTNTVYMDNGPLFIDGSVAVVYTQNSDVIFIGDNNVVHGGIVNVTGDAGSGNVTSGNNPCAPVTFDYTFAPNATSCAGVGVAAHERPLSFNLYPNPATENVTLQIPSNFAGSIGIVDALGRNVQTKLMSNQTTTELNVSQMEPGFYFVWLETATGNRTTKPLVIR